MANGMNARASSRRGKLGWIAAAAAVAYIFLAQLPLEPTRALSFVDSEPRQALNAQVGAIPEGAWAVKGRFFIPRGDLQGVQEIDRSGKRLWSAEFPSAVTAADITETISAWGLLDGSIHLVGGDGVARLVVKPASAGAVSRFACIYGLALSPDGTSMAALFGLEPQHFTVFEQEGNGYRLAYDRKLFQPLRSGQPLAFSADGKSIVGFTGDGLVFYDAVRGRASTLQNAELQGECEMTIAPIGNDGFAFLAAAGDSRYAGLLRQGRVEAIFPIEAGSDGLLVDGMDIIIQGKNKLHRYKVESR